MKGAVKKTKLPPAILSPECVKDRAEAAQQISLFLESLRLGHRITERQYAFVSWILTPIIYGDHPSKLPFPMRGRGEHKTWRGSYAHRVALEVRYLMKREGMKKDAAIAKVADSPKYEGSVRGHYERANKKQLDEELKWIV